MSPVPGTKDTHLKGVTLPMKTPTFNMSEIKLFTVPCLDLECFLSAKVKLRQEGILDSVLKNNLEHAIQIVLPMPVVKRKDVALLVEGERQLVRFIAGTPTLHYIVRLGPGGPELHQKVQIQGARLTPSCIADAHFAGHRCRDEFESCAEQARRALCINHGKSDHNNCHAEEEPGVANVEIRITCGELKLTYCTSQQPKNSIDVQPRRRVNLGRALSPERVLEVKSMLESDGIMSPGLLVCFQHLLLQHGQYQAADSRLVLQADGQMLELISGRHDYHSAQHFIFSDSQSHAHSLKVQDIDLWDYD